MLSMGRSLRIGIALLSCALAASACTKVQARTPAPLPTPAEPPPLATPEPPSRLKVPVPVDPPPPGGSVTDKPAAAGANRAKPATPPPASSTAPPVTPPATPPETVTPVIQAGADVEKSARERLDRAVSDLKRVQKSSLPADAREQFDSAERFVRMARDAMTLKNFVYAAYCADKAATLASLLVKERGRAPLV